MRHAFSGPFSVKVTSQFGTVNPQGAEVQGGIRTARRVAKRATETGERNAAFAVVLDIDKAVVFECRNINGRAVQVGAQKGVDHVKL